MRTLCRRCRVSYSVLSQTLDTRVRGVTGVQGANLGYTQYITRIRIYSRREEKTQNTTLGWA